MLGTRNFVKSLGPNCLNLFSRKEKIDFILSNAITFVGYVAVLEIHSHIIIA